MEDPAPTSAINALSSGLQGSGGNPFGKSISDTPYRFNLDRRPDAGTLLRQHMRDFKSISDFNTVQASKLYLTGIPEPDLWMIKNTFGPVLSQLALTAKHFTVDFFSVGAFHRTFLLTACHESCTSSHLLPTGNAVAVSGASAAHQIPTEGAAAKLHLLLRVTMSVFPWSKTESEVATMEYLRTQTTIPVPRIYAFDSSVNNPIRLEWILMEKPAGQPYDRVFAALSGKQKKSLAKSFAKSMAGHTKALSKLQFNKIGSLYCNWAAAKPGFFIGPAVDLNLLLASRRLYPIEHAVFPCLQHYFMAFLELKMQYINMCYQLLIRTAPAAIITPSGRNAKAGGKGAVKGKPTPSGESSLIMQARQRFQRIVSASALFGARFKSSEDKNSPTTLTKTAGELSRIMRACQRFHQIVSASSALAQIGLPTSLQRQGLVESDVLVDASGHVTAILDWDGVMALPKCLGDRATGDGSRGGLGGVLESSPGLTDREMDRVLRAKDEEGEKKKTKTKKKKGEEGPQLLLQGVAVSTVVKTLAGYMFAVEEDVSGAEKWLTKLEMSDALV